MSCCLVFAGVTHLNSGPWCDERSTRRSGLPTMRHADLCVACDDATPRERLGSVNVQLRPRLCERIAWHRRLSRYPLWITSSTIRLASTQQGSKNDPTSVSTTRNVTPSRSTVPNRCIDQRAALAALKAKRDQKILEWEMALKVQAAWRGRVAKMLVLTMRILRVSCFRLMALSRSWPQRILRVCFFRASVEESRTTYATRWANKADSADPRWVLPGIRTKFE